MLCGAGLIFQPIDFACEACTWLPQGSSFKFKWRKEHANWRRRLIPPGSPRMRQQMPIAFPGIRTHSEFYYYLDSRAPVELLAERRQLEIHPQMIEVIRSHREKDYA